MAQNEAQAGIRTAMGQEMTDIENKQLAEESRLRDLGAQMDLSQAEGAQMAAANAEEAAAAATSQGIQGLIGMGQQGLNMVNLYPKSGKPATTSTAAGPAPTNPQPGTAASYGPAGTNWAPMSSFSTPPQQNTFQPQLPQPGTQYGMFGTNFSGVGYKR